MADAACAEEEEGLKRLIARAQVAIMYAENALATIRRVERGEITVKKAAIEASVDEVDFALNKQNDVIQSLERATDALHNNITGCAGCPT